MAFWRDCGRLSVRMKAKCILTHLNPFRRAIRSIRPDGRLTG